MREATTLVLVLLLTGLLTPLAIADEDPEHPCIGVTDPVTGICYMSRDDHIAHLELTEQPDGTLVKDGVPCFLNVNKCVTLTSVQELTGDDPVQTYVAHQHIAGISVVSGLDLLAAGRIF